MKDNTELLQSYTKMLAQAGVINDAQYAMLRDMLRSIRRDERLHEAR